MLEAPLCSLRYGGRTTPAADGPTGRPYCSIGAAAPEAKSCAVTFVACGRGTSGVQSRSLAV
jgi:hypothetical protein